KYQPFNQGTQQNAQHDCCNKRDKEIPAQAGNKVISHEAAEGVELSMGKVHDFHDAENQRQPDTEQRIGAPQYQRIGNVLKKLIHCLPHFRAWISCDGDGALPPPVGNQSLLTVVPVGQCCQRHIRAQKQARMCGRCLVDYRYDLAVLDLDKIGGGVILGTGLVAFAVRAEGDLSVQAVKLHIPKRLANVLGRDFVDCLDGGGDGVDAVIATEAFGETCHVQAALVPLFDEGLGFFGMGCAV